MALPPTSGPGPDDQGTRIYYCPRCHARNLGRRDWPPICAACGLPLGPEDAAPPPDTRGRASALVSLGVVAMLGFIVWQQRHQLGTPGLGMGAVLGLDGVSAEDIARGRSAAIRLCSAQARSRMGPAFDDTPFDDANVRLNVDGGYSIRSRTAGADSLGGLTHAGFTCRVQKQDASFGGWEITEFTVQGDEAGPAPPRAAGRPAG